MLGPVQLVQADLAALILGGVHAELFQGEEVRPGSHGSSADDDGGNIDAGQADEVAGHALVAGGDEDAGVEGGCICLDLDHIGDHFTAREGIIDTVVALGLAVADIRAEISGAEAAGFKYTAAGFPDEPVQMAGSRMAVAEGALNEDLDPVKIFRLPAGADAERIHFRGKFAELLTDEFFGHGNHLSWNIF